MRIVRTIEKLREQLDEARAAGARVAFVPTMGWLHDGHLALVERAKRDAEIVVISVFVNPTQFNDPSDLQAYPRDEVRDIALASQAGAGYFFAPPVEEIYPAGFATTVMVRGLSDVLEGASRGAAHFHGVTTVVAKLLNIVRPHVAYFGQKDAQQALIIRRMVRDLDFGIAIEVAPTVRESDGLALSSRNVRIAPADRGRALALRKGLDAAAAAIAAGDRDPRSLERKGKQAMHASGIEAEYFAVVSPDTLEPLTALRGGDTALIAVAAQVGVVRLIDNDLITAPASPP